MVKAIPVNEAALQGYVGQLAQVHGWLTYHTHDSRRSDPGFPDLVLVRPPRLIFAELKSANGRLTQTQEMWLGDLEKLEQVEVYVWRPADIPKLDGILKR